MGKFYFWYDGPDPEEWHQGNRIYLGVRGLDGLPLEGDPFGDDIDVALEAFGDTGQWLSRLNRITLSQDASLLWWVESPGGEVSRISAMTLPDKTPITWGPDEDIWDAEGDVFTYLPVMVSPSLGAPKKLVGALPEPRGWDDYELMLSTVSLEGGAFEYTATPVGETPSQQPSIPAIRKDGGALFGIPSDGRQVVSLFGGEGTRLASIVTEGVPADLLQLLGAVHTPEGTEFALLADYASPPSSPEETVRIAWAPLDGGTHSLSALHFSDLGSLALAFGGGRTSSSGALGVPMMAFSPDGMTPGGWQFTVLQPDGQTQAVALEVPVDAGIYFSWDAQQNHWVFWYDVLDPDAPPGPDGAGRRLGGALILDGDDLSVKNEITDFYPLVQGSRPKGLWYVPSEGPAEDTCVPFWMGFHNTVEELDCSSEDDEDDTGTYPDGVSAVRFYFNEGLGASPAVANDATTYGVRSSLSIGGDPTTGYSLIAATPYFFGFHGMTVVDFAGDNAGATVAEDPDRGWYFEVPYEALGGDAAWQPVDLEDPSGHSPTRVYSSSSFVAAAVGVYSSGVFVELGYGVRGGSWPEVDINLSPSGSGP